MWSIRIDAIAVIKYNECINITRSTIWAAVLPTFHVRTS